MNLVHDTELRFSSTTQATTQARQTCIVQQMMTQSSPISLIHWPGKSVNKVELPGRTSSSY